ncbi:hypothetical protein Q3G72_024681 [Acer saccharum]|nr:hypothetical protein Q3G72_024681 [Acer saccharum]
MSVFVFKSQSTITVGVKAKHLVEAGPLKDGPKEGQRLFVQSKSKGKEIQFIGPTMPTKVGHNIISNDCENGPNEDMVGPNPFNNTAVRLADQNGKVSTPWTRLGKRLTDNSEEGHSWSDGDRDGSRDSCGGSKKCKVSIEGVENDT